MIAALEGAYAAARAMTPRAFGIAKTFAHPAIVYCAHGDGKGRLVLVDRAYRVLGSADKHSDYASPRFDHLRIDDTPALRALAASINEDGRSYWPSGVRVPIVYLMVNADTRESYCARMRAVLALVKEQRYG